MNRLALLILVCATATASAQVFKRVGPDGKVYFSDQPGPDVRQIEVAPAQAVSLPAVAPAQGESVGEEDPIDNVYTLFSIVSPGSDQAIRTNNGSVTVQLSILPELMPGHMIKMMVDGEDGETITSGAALSIMLSNLSRGRHSIQAMVVDGAGEVLIKTGIVEFNVLRVTGGGG